MNRQINSFVFDFDSTLVTLESFDELIKAAIADHPDRRNIEREIESITDAGMNGEIDLSESLARRLRVARIEEQHVIAVRTLLAASITPGMQEVIGFLHAQACPSFIMSGGFLELIYPVADTLAIPLEHCFANEFFKANGVVTGIDFANPLARSSGKAEIISGMKQAGNRHIICIGDGMSDAIPYLQGIADEFWGFFQNKDRPKVREKAVRSFDSSECLLEHLRENF